MDANGRIFLSMAACASTGPSDARDLQRIKIGPLFIITLLLLLFGGLLIINNKKFCPELHLARLFFLVGFGFPSFACERDGRLLYFILFYFCRHLFIIISLVAFFFFFFFFFFFSSGPFCLLAFFLCHSRCPGALSLFAFRASPPLPLSPPARTGCQRYATSHPYNYLTYHYYLCYCNIHLWFMIIIIIIIIIIILFCWPHICMIHDTLNSHALLST